MSTSTNIEDSEQRFRLDSRSLADHAFLRAAGASLIAGNDVQLLRDARQNYPAWLDAIRDAKQHIHFECYIIHDDDAGETFAEALIEKAREGVAVRLIYDWMGGFGKTSRHFWKRLRSAGVEVRCYNPPRLDSPFGWLSRDHRKMLAVDHEVGFITGLCVGRMWVGQPDKIFSLGVTPEWRYVVRQSPTSNMRSLRSGRCWVKPFRTKNSMELPLVQEM